MRHWELGVLDSYELHITTGALEMRALGYAVALVAVTFVGILWLQWFLPQDGPIEMVLSWCAAPLIGAGIAAAGRAAIPVIASGAFVAIVPVCFNYESTGAWMLALGNGQWKAALSLGVLTLVALSVPVVTTAAVGWASTRTSRAHLAISPTAWVSIAMAFLWQACVFYPEYTLRRADPWRAMFHEMQVRALAGERALTESGASPGAPVAPVVDVEVRNRGSSAVTMSFAWAGRSARARLDRLRPEPEVWVDFGDGRVVRFDLATRRATSVD